MTSTVLHSLTVPWIRPPHRMDLLLSDELPDGYTVSTAVVVALDSADRTLLTRVDLPGRGWELPGGHLDPGESAPVAAARELAEETGLDVRPDRLTLYGGQRITLLGPPPAEYRYAARGFMAFYTVRLDHEGAPTRPHPDSECAQAEWLGRDDVALRAAGAAWLPLHAALFD
ncbi:NUDIX hydrolase [Streptomyces sp. SID3343]|uniref:NUDIX hydrolase n=1 Tax=Streptomyces sp. SID3343 TaxID=2690260 RepID=UPI00137123D9|nr:NUDIX hydrolase [Streptomyces sp. SID3343]MYW05645.1 NUDIX domain-containing protein [Streptomyces sp. SID3343]